MNDTVSSLIRGTIFVRDLARAAAFYSALGFNNSAIARANSRRSSRVPLWIAYWRPPARKIKRGSLILDQIFV